jgi:signal transduction histidine kinase
MGASIGEFSAIIAHELNNIAAPLRGFIDLVAENPASADSIRQCLDEVGVGIARIVALSHEIESLADSNSHRTLITIGDCIAHIELDDPNPSREVFWSCNPLTRINVDTFQAMRAIASLARIATAVALTISGDLRDDVSCAVCGDSLSPGNRYLLIEVRAARALSVNLIRNPFDSNLRVAAGLRLTSAVLVHCTHLAGGHIVADEGAETMSLALPIA